MNENQKNFFLKTLDIASQKLTVIANDFFRITRPNIDLYNFAKSKIGKDIAPIENALACMEAVNMLIEDYTGKAIGGELSTYKGYGYLKVDKRFIQTSNPELGDIIISPSGYGNGKLHHGHIGIISEDEKIMSNNSENGLWDEHLDLETWKRKYIGYGGFPVYYYRLINK